MRGLILAGLLAWAPLAGARTLNDANTLGPCVVQTFVDDLQAQFDLVVADRRVGQAVRNLPTAAQRA